MRDLIGLAILFLNLKFEHFERRLSRRLFGYDFGIKDWRRHNREWPRLSAAAVAAAHDL